VYEFISAAMPADQPASLEAEQYWNVLAFVLQSNGTPVDGTQLNDTSSEQITPHTAGTLRAASADAGAKPWSSYQSR
jgi:hypothetical protein